MNSLQKFLNSWALPLAMTIGALCHRWLESFAAIMPALLFAMIFITYTRISLRDVRITPQHIKLFAVQLSISIALFLVVNRYNSLWAEGFFICMLAPTAASAAVITSMLGGNLGFLATYTFAGNLLTGLVVPILFPLLGIQNEMPFGKTILQLNSQLFPLLILPFLLSIALHKLWPAGHKSIRNHPEYAFYLWVVSLTLVTARTVHYLTINGKTHLTDVMVMALGALVLCLTQFALGRKMGMRWGDVVSGGQALGQKNTVLAIWLAQSYMHPLASVAPAAYILWQNSINTLQLWRYRKLNKSR